MQHLAIQHTHTYASFCALINVLQLHHYQHQPDMMHWHCALSQSLCLALKHANDDQNEEVIYHRLWLEMYCIESKMKTREREREIPLSQPKK